MEEIVFVTHNKGKVASANKHFKDIKFQIYEYELDEPRSDDVGEISRSKVKEAYDLVKKPCIALDCGFFIPALNGFPRAFVNFALDTIHLDGILKMMEGKENRECYFLECLSYYDGVKVKQFFGKQEGKLATKILGEDTNEKWSDLWYIYIPQGSEKTLAQMTREERDHRKKNENEKRNSTLMMFSEWYQNREK